MPDFPVARLADLVPSRGRVVRAGAVDVALFRVGGEVHALENTCVHNGGPLGEGDVEDGCAVCPWHGWRYDLVTGASPISPMVRVNTYPAWVASDGQVWVRVE